MDTKGLYRLVYCSRNRIKGSHSTINAELQHILASARKNNPALSLTGALLYNSGNFAQVLEGPLASIERIFEAIQCDSRHSEVTVVQSGPLEKRDFPEWSMAFVGSRDASEMPVATAAFDAVFSDPHDAGGQILQMLKDLIVSDYEWILLDAA